MAAGLGSGFFGWIFGFGTSKYSAAGTAFLVLTSDIMQEEDSLARSSPRTKFSRGPYRKQKSLGDPDINEETLRRRLSVPKKYLMDFCKQEGEQSGTELEMVVLLALLMKNVCYNKNRRLARVADGIILHAS